MRTIDADRLLSERMMSTYYHLPNGDTAIPIIDIEHAPTVSAQLERKRGRWKQWEEYGFEDTYECTVCKTPFVLIDGTPMDNEYYFCPHCGADMREGEADEG